MAFYYQRGNIDVDNYSFGVISGIGCLSIIITSEELFAVFADRVLMKTEMRMKVSRMLGKIK